MNNHCLVESGWLVVLSQWQLEDTMLQALLSVFEAINRVGLPFMSGGEPRPMHGKSELAGKLCLPFKVVSAESSIDSAAGCVLGPSFLFSS